MFCSRCGKEVTENGMFCSGCGVSLTDGWSAKKTWRSTASGVINIVDGCLMVLLTPIYISAALSPDEFEGSSWGYWLVVTVLAVFGILAIVGGICALRRKGWGWALAGAIAGIIPFFPLGIASIVFLTMSRDEFRRPQAQRPNV